MLSELRTLKVVRPQEQQEEQEQRPEYLQNTDTWSALRSRQKTSKIVTLFNQERRHRVPVCRRRRPQR